MVAVKFKSFIFSTSTLLSRGLAGSIAYPRSNRSEVTIHPEWDTKHTHCTHPGNLLACIWGAGNQITQRKPT